MRDSVIESHLEQLEQEGDSNRVNEAKSSALFSVLDLCATLDSQTVGEADVGHLIARQIREHIARAIGVPDTEFD